MTVVVLQVQDGIHVPVQVVRDVDELPPELLDLVPD